MTDDQLIQISRNVDDYISSLLMKYDMSALSLTAVLLARAMVLNKEVGSSEDFAKLLVSVVQNPPMERNEIKVH
jgi:hypothetical protein